MDIFNVLTLVGGLCLFLFGMNLMGQALERRAGGKLRSLLDKMTSRVFVGFLTGLGITAIIQSSSATTVMVVGFVNSGLMTLRQAINVIMGANVGTTVTAWLLSLAGIDSGSTWVQLLKPSSFTPVLALVGIIFYMFCKDSHKKDTGAILLGFAYLVATRTIQATIPVTIVATVFVLTALNTGSAYTALIECMSGGLLFGAVFMATDYVTSPFTTKGKLFYGVFIGLITFLIRHFGSMNEGMSYAILLGNLMTPWFNAWGHQTPLGYKKPKKAKKGGAE